MSIPMATLKSEKIFFKHNWDTKMFGVPVTRDTHILVDFSQFMLDMVQIIENKIIGMLFEHLPGIMEQKM